MEVFNVICGICSIIGLLVSVFTAGKVIKILKITNYSNGNNNFQVDNGGIGNTYHGDFVGGNRINSGGKYNK